VISNSHADKAEELGLRADELSGGTNACGDGSPLRSGLVCSDLAEEVNAEFEFRNAAIVTGVLGGLFLAGGIVLLVLPGRNGDVDVGIMGTPSGGLLSLRGGF
jgi:hypothetical protein